MLGAAGAVWAGAALGRSWGVATFLVLLPALATRRAWLVAALLAGGVGGVLSAEREASTLDAPLPSGRVAVAGRLLEDPRPYGDGMRFRFQPAYLETRLGWEPWAGPRLAVTTDAIQAAAGEQAVISGILKPNSGHIRGDPIAGVLERVEVVAVEPADHPLFRTGNWARSRVRRMLGGRHAAGALLSGFLIGDVANLPAEDVENLRRAGLAHFVAVSGSNVALFLSIWFVAAGPLGWSPGRRALAGLLGLALFLVITRWEPSVVRASLMAGLMLVARVGGIPLTTWSALSAATLISILIAPQLTGDVGFQLSVAATAGVLVGNVFARARSWGKLRTALAITLGAQGAVAPLMLWRFGSVPLLSPLTNLIAAPLVTAATVAGGGAVAAGWSPLVGLAVGLAEMVLEVSRLAAAGPQLGTIGILLTAAAGFALRFRTLRPLLALGGVLVLSFSVLPPSRVAVPTAVFLDVGQGDAALLLGPAGETVLIDGGPDPAILAGKLRKFGVDHFDLVVATHGDRDHIGGLGSVVSRYPVGTLWHPGHRDGSTLYRDLLDEAARLALAISAPQAGWRASVGDFDIEVLGPGRRYADINDESLVLRVEAGALSVLFTGDIEDSAQQELGPVKADILKVPHHGAATTDLDWLEAAAAPVSVISVGENDFGHPHPDVLDVLEQTGSSVRRTDLEGDIVMPLR